MHHISIITENDHTDVNTLLQCMTKNKVTANAIKTNTIGMTNIFTIQVDKPDIALKKLHEQSIKAVSDNHILIKIKDEPGALAEISQTLRQANLEADSIHIMHLNSGYTIVAISTNELSNTKKLLNNILIA